MSTSKPSTYNALDHELVCIESSLVVRATVPTRGTNLLLGDKLHKFILVKACWRCLLKPQKFIQITEVQMVHSDTLTLSIAVYLLHASTVHCTLRAADIGCRGK
jgi:hypothetical protein